MCVRWPRNAGATASSPISADVDDAGQDQHEQDDQQQADQPDPAGVRAAPAAAVAPATAGEGEDDQDDDDEQDRRHGVPLSAPPMRRDAPQEPLADVPTSTLIRRTPLGVQVAAQPAHEPLAPPSQPDQAISLRNQACPVVAHVSRALSSSSGGSTDDVHDDGDQREECSHGGVIRAGPHATLPPLRSRIPVTPLRSDEQACQARQRWQTVPPHQQQNQLAPLWTWMSRMSPAPCGRAPWPASPARTRDTSPDTARDAWRRTFASALVSTGACARTRAPVLPATDFPGGRSRPVPARSPRGSPCSRPSARPSGLRGRASRR